MIYDLKKISKNEIDQKISFLSYDYVIIGTGPSGTVLLNQLKKKKKKVLVLERGNFKDKQYESVLSNQLKIKKNSRTFTVGGTSEDWSNIYSKFENFELKEKKKNSNKNLWPLSYAELLSYYNKINKKFFLKLTNIRNNQINSKFITRLFYAPKQPVNFSKFYQDINFDIIINCSVDLMDEKNDLVNLRLSNKFSTFKTSVKKTIICAGGLESVRLIMKSINNGMLKSLKNKRYLGKFFMDHPKINLGYIKFPKEILLDKIALKVKKSHISYYGISLNKIEQSNENNLNTYVRFVKVNSRLNILIDLLCKNFSKTIKKYINNFKTNSNKYLIRAFMEMEPRYDNSIALNKKNKIVLKFDIGKKEIETLNNLTKKIYNHFSLNKDKEMIKIFNKKNLILTDASHHMGGLIFPRLVNKNLKLNGLKNIYCCSSAIFPTSGSVNPTYTICALALRLGYFLTKNK